jgi:hypothetical protein
MSAVRAGWRRCAAGGRGRWRHDLSILGVGQSNPLPMAHLEGSIVPQRALGGRAQAKLRGQLPEAASDARELVGSRARPAQVVDWRSPDAVQVHKPHEEGAVCVQKRREMRRVEPGCMLPDPPHDTAHALVALPDGLRWVRGLAGASSVAVASLMISSVKPVARLFPGAALRVSRAWPRASLYARLRVVSVRDSYFQVQNALAQSGSHRSQRRSIAPQDELQYCRDSSERKRGVPNEIRR